MTRVNEIVDSKIEWYVIKGWFGFGKEQKQSTATMGALLQRKQDVVDDLDARRGGSTEQTGQSTLAQLQEQRQQKGPATTPKPPGAKDSGNQQSAPPPPQTPPDNQSTTGRLLDMKRKRNSEDKDNDQ